MIFDLLPEIQDEIFSYCSFDDLKSLASTCPGNVLMAKVLHTIRIPQSDLQKRWWFNRRKLEKTVGNLRNTKVLIASVPFNKAEHIIKAITALDNLVELRLDGEVDDCVLSHISVMINLKKIDIDVHVLTSAGLAHLRNLLLLDELCLRNVTLDDVGLSNIAFLVTLRKLHLMYPNNYLVDVELSYVTTLAQLEELCLHHCKLTNGGLSNISKLTTLRKLYANVSGYCTDAGISSLRTLLNLEELSLQYSFVTNTGLWHISNFHTLRKLDMKGCTSFTELGISYIRSLVNLEELRLSHCRVNNAGLAHISTVPTLKILDFTSCRGITDEGILYLDKLPNLRELHLLHCLYITETGISNFKRLRVDCTVHSAYE